MSVLSSKARDDLQANQFALPGGRFPITDLVHARAALSGAPRAEHAGNISAAEEATVERKANAFLTAHEGAAHHADGVKS